MGGRLDKSPGNPWLAASISSLRALFVTADIVASLAIDHFGSLRMEQHAMIPWRAPGAAMMIGGVAPIARF